MEHFIHYLHPPPTTISVWEADSHQSFSVVSFFEVYICGVQNFCLTAKPSCFSYRAAGTPFFMNPGAATKLFITRVSKD